jgi:hypothetical protein
MGEITRKARIRRSQSEPYSPWQVRAELSNHELKISVRHTMAKTKAPKCLWDYCPLYHSEICNFTAHPLFILQGQTPYELVTGNTPDITEYTDFSWYDTTQRYIISPLILCSYCKGRHHMNSSLETPQT